MSGRELMVGDKPLSSLRVVDLKAELEKRGLSKSGTKKDLVDRLKTNLLLDKGREEAAASAAKIDEGELPNIAAKLPDDNPFVREYLQSQAELFHSQQVAKKLYREEQKRESEGSGASADEREKSPLKSPLTTLESLSPVRHHVEEHPIVLTTTCETEREKSPEKRSRGRPPGSSKSPVRMVEEAKTGPIPEMETPPPPPPPPKSPSKELEPTSPLKHLADDKVEITQTRSAEREKSPEKRSTRGRPTRSKSPVHVEEVKEDKARVIPEEEEAPLPTSPVKILRPTSPLKHQEEEKQVRRKEDSEQPQKSPEKEVAKALVVEREKSPEKRSTRGRPARSKSPVEAEETKEKVPIVPEEEEAPPPVLSPIKSSQQEKHADVDEPEKVVDVAKSPTKAVPPNHHATTVEVTVSPVKDKEVEEKPETVMMADLEEPEEAGVPLPTMQPIPSQSPPPPAKRTKSRFAAPEAPVPVDLSEKITVVKTRTKIIPIEFHDSDVTKSDVKVKEKEKEKIRRTSGELTKGKDVEPSVPPPETTGRRNSTAMEKENILDEVLDYGDDDVADMAEFDYEPTTSVVAKKPSVTLPPPPPASKSKPKEKVESPQEEVEEEEEYEPIEFERRIVKIKPNKHSQRRKEKFEEDRAEREKKRYRHPMVVTSQLMKEWYPDSVMLTAEEWKLLQENPPSTPPPEVERKLRITRTISNVDSSVDTEMVQGSGESGGEDEETTQEMDLTIQRKISIISMDEEMTKGQTPPRRAPTQLILVTNLVRPFTIPQLKELLQRTGNVLDLWVDKIKSKCVAKYDTEDEAIETRTALHGVKWPLSNPKSLSVDFTTEERVDDLRKKDSGYVEEKPATSQHVREWDMGKSSPPRGHRKRSHSRDKEERDRDRDKDKKRSRRSSSPGHGRRRTRSPHSDRKDRNGDLKKSEASGKTLDELFRKTVATPCIYWLPLNPQQIAEKEELRRKRMEERERRIAEMQHQHRPQR